MGGVAPALQQALHEVFHYDPAGKRLDAPVPRGTEGSRGWVRHNRVKVLQDKRFDYDGFGRLVRKRICAHTALHCRYDALHRMTAASVIRAGCEGEPLRHKGGGTAVPIRPIDVTVDLRRNDLEVLG